MIRRALLPFEENRKERFSLLGDDASLSANQALLVAMAIHELATNAVKYGALSNDTGKVALTWSIQGRDETRILKLEWRESGGPPVSPPSRQGFGTILIERAVQQEQGRSCFDYRPEGVVCALEMKI